MDKFCLVADGSSKVPKLRNKIYTDFKLSLAKWEFLNLIREVLEVCLDFFCLFLTFILLI